jgi:RsiW-degrading membrane proteinase PrsW (M82 family)
MAMALIYIAVLVPAIEEIFKPIGVWLFAGKLEPAQGLTLGALSGAGYALIETIGVTSQTSEWASLLFSRIGTGLLHITTSALMGGAIVLAWRERRYLRLLGSYFLAVLLHGLWNSLAIIFTFSTLAELFEQPGSLGTIQLAMIIAMAILSVVLFMILLISNHGMRKTVTSPSTEPTLPGDNIEISETT